VNYETLTINGNGEAFEKSIREREKYARYEAFLCFLLISLLDIYRNNLVLLVKSIVISPAFLTVTIFHHFRGPI
jgi:hypothetical protein